MIRRDFLIKSGLLGSALFVPSVSSCSRAIEEKTENIHAPIRNKVKMAMLSLQKQNWEHGIAAQAFVESGDETMMILMAREAVTRQGADGRLAVISTANGINDSATPLEAVLRTAEITGDESMKEAADRMLEYLFERAPRTEEGYIHHSYHGPELWADSIYMAPPFVAYAGYPEEAYRQAKAIIDRLWIEEEALFAYRWNAETGEISHSNLWGLANAHAIAGMTKLIGHLPPAMSAESNILKGFVRQHLEGCLRYMRDDYLFHNNINEPSTFVETSLAMRVADSVFKGIKEGWLENDYLDTALNIRTAVHEKVDDLGYVTGVPGPTTYARPAWSSEGQAFFLMMEASYDKLQI
ncbi:MAG: glycosyl hydrolase [Marinilabiliales bacterium]|nr:MAG: glycosyl hydrolase [Marinilabiliales bacterium]